MCGESILSPAAPETTHHRLFFQRGGKGALERAELFPGLTLTRMCIRERGLPPPRRPDRADWN